MGDTLSTLESVAAGLQSKQTEPVIPPVLATLHGGKTKLLAVGQVGNRKKYLQVAYIIIPGTEVHPVASAHPYAVLYSLLPTEIYWKGVKLCVRHTSLYRQ